MISSSCCRSFVFSQDCRIACEQSRRKLSASALRLALVLLALPGATIAHAQPAKPAAPLRIGVTLHPYYSWTMNVVGKLPGYEVRPILPGEIDAGDYQPRPEDIKKLIDLDAIVVNGIGHDDFIMPMIKASGEHEARRDSAQRGDAADSRARTAPASTRTRSSRSPTRSSRPTRSRRRWRRCARRMRRRCSRTRPSTPGGCG